MEECALLTLVDAVVPPAAAGVVEGPEAGVGGTAAGKVVAGADIVWDVIYCRGAISNSAQIVVAR